MAIESNVGVASRVFEHKKGLVVLREIDCSAFPQFWLVEMTAQELESWWCSQESFSSSPGLPEELLSCEISKEPLPTAHNPPVIPGNMLVAKTEADRRLWIRLLETRRYYSCVLCCDCDSYLESPEGRRIYHRNYPRYRPPALGLRESPFLPPDLKTSLHSREQTGRMNREGLEDPPSLNPYLLGMVSRLMRGSRARLQKADELIRELRSLDADLTRSPSLVLAEFILECWCWSMSEAAFLRSTVGKDDPCIGWQRKRQRMYRLVLHHVNALGLLGQGTAERGATAGRE